LVPDEDQRNVDEFDAGTKHLRAISTLSDENQFLRSLSTRLEAELKEYQIRFPQLLAENVDNANVLNPNTETPLGPNDATNLQHTDLAPWMSSSKYMSPLLMAYDCRIRELQEQIALFQTESMEIKKESEALIRRNSELEQELETKMVSLHQKLKIKNKALNEQLHRHENGTGGGRAGGDALGDDVIDDHQFNEYQQRVHILTQQNKLLRESELRWNQEKQTMLDLMAEHKATIEALRSELSTLGAVHEELEETANRRQYENDDLKQMNHDLKHDVVAKLTDKMGHYEQRLKAECTEHDALKKRWSRFEAEYAALNEAHHKMDEKYAEIRADNVELEQRAEALNDAVKEQKNMVSATESKLKATKEAVATLENVLSVYKKAEMESMKQINALKANHDLFVNVEKDRLLAENEALSKQVAALKAQKEALWAEGEGQRAEIEEKVTLKLEQKQQSLAQTVKEMTTRNATLNAERHRFQTRCQVMEREAEEIKEEMLKRFDGLKSTENELQCRVKQLELEKERVSESAERKEKELTQQTKLWKSEREVLSQTVAELNRNDDKKNLALIQDQEAILELNEEIEKLKERLSVEGSRSGKVIGSLQSKLVRNEAAFKETIEHYKAELGKFENLYSESQAMTKEIIAKHEAMSRKWKEENRSSFSNFSNIVDELKAENKSLVAVNLTLQGKMERVLGNQRNTVSENENMNKRLLNEQKSTRSLTESVENLKAMNQSHRKKETLLLTENKNLRNELSKAQIARQRLQRNHQFNAKINGH